jgi:hypothetical protein
MWAGDLPLVPEKADTLCATLRAPCQEANRASSGRFQTALRSPIRSAGGVFAKGPGGRNCGGE